MEMVRTQAEARFREAQDALPAHARVARAAAMFVWARGVIGREILARSGPLPRKPASCSMPTPFVAPSRTGRCFNPLTCAEALKIDIYPREMIPGELDRSALLEIFEGMQIPVVSRPDAAAASKLAPKQH